MLLRAGVNLFPEHDADNYVTIIKKVRLFIMLNLLYTK